MDWTVLLVAAIAAVGGITAALSQWRMHRAQGRHTEIDAQGEIISDLHSHIDWLRTEREALVTKLNHLDDELRPNGGKSLRDVVDRIEAAQQAHISEVSDRLTNLEARLDRIEAA